MLLHAGKAAGAARVLVLSCLSVLLASCGGGGSSGSSGSASGPPAIPSPSYSGSREPAAVGTGTVVNFEQLAGLAISFVQAYQGEAFLHFQPKTYNETDKGKTGTVTVTGVIAADGTGWLNEVLTDYSTTQLPEEVQNGTLIVEINSSGTTLGFSDLSLSVNGEALTYNGSIAVHDDSVGNLSVSGGGGQLLISDLTLKDVNDQTSVSGRIYDSASGYIDISTPVPGNVGDYYGVFDDVFPAGSGTGQVLIKGRNGASVTVEPLGDNFMFLGVDQDGDGKIDYGTRMLSSSGAIDTVPPFGSSVSAMVDLPPQDTSNVRTVDGRFSYVADGFVSYDWSLLAAPLGSHVAISGTGPELQFTADVPGQYLVQLTATDIDSGDSAIDVVAVDGEPTSTRGTTEKLPSYIYTHVGNSVTVDNRATSYAANEDDGPIDESWTLRAPPGSTASLQNQHTPTFTPDVAGLYLIESSVGYFSVVSADLPIRFAPMGNIASQVDSISLGAFPGAPNDIVFAGGSSTNQTIQWWKPGSAGLFGQGGSLTPGTGETTALLAADLNGDGSTDFVTPMDTSVTGCPLEVRKSSAYTAISAALATPCPLSADISVMHSGTFSGKPGVVFLSTYGGKPSLVSLVENSGGTLQAPVVTNLQSGDTTAFDFQLHDFTGDGIPDAAVSVQNSSVHSFVEIYRGDATGAFTYLASYALGTPNWPVLLAVGDLNNDGKTDVAATADGQLHLLYGDGTGAFPSSDTRTIGGIAKYVAAVDLDADGHLDVVLGYDDVQSPSDTELGIYLGSSGVLGQEQSYAFPDIDTVGFGVTETSIVTSDFNGDGKPDLMLRTSGASIINVPSALYYTVSLPAITSATLTHVDTSVRVSRVLKRRTAMIHSPWVRRATLMAHHKPDVH